jgi:two-component sensor histidine kinase
LLTKSSWTGADLRALISEVVEPFYDRATVPRFSVEGPPIWLRPKVIVTFSMIFHELATNSVKYGALSSETGRVKLSWRVSQDQDQTFELNWEESGGPQIETPRRRGFGSMLIENGVAQELAGQVRMLFAPSGFVCTINAPLHELSEEGESALQST